MSTRHLAQRVARRHLDAEWNLIAKPKYLKAIDFTIGLIRRLLQEGKPLPSSADTHEVVRRLAELRKRVQEGFRLDTLAQNLKSLTRRGAVLLKTLESDERDRLLPSDRVLAAFMRPMPNKLAQALAPQAALMERVISKQLGVPTQEIPARLLSEERFMMDAYAAVVPEISKRYSSIVSKMGGAASGTFSHRVKNGKSCWGKQAREGGIPFIMFKDLVGTRVVTPSIPAMAETAAGVQSKFDIVVKDNYFLKGAGYNAINYALADDWLTFEFQLKTIANDVEAAVSHDLIYAQEKAIASLTNEEKYLVGMVIDVSTQLSMREWQEAFQVPMASWLNGQHDHPSFRDRRTG